MFIYRTFFYKPGKAFRRLTFILLDEHLIIILLQNIELFEFRLSLS